VAPKHLPARRNELVRRFFPEMGADATDHGAVPIAIVAGLRGRVRVTPGESKDVTGVVCTGH
jgi:hypothetical protein